MDFNQFILALRARRKAFVVTLVATIVTAIAVALIVPKKYVATATLLVDARDEQTMSPGRMSARERASYLQTQVDLLMSNRVATQVARDLKLAQKPGMRDAWERDTGGAGSIDEWIAGNLLQKIDVDTSTSNFILVNYPSDNARAAAEIANGFTKAYIDTQLHLRTEPSREAAEWFNEQVKTLRTQVAQAQGRLNVYQKEKGILADDRADVEATRFADLSSQLLAARNAASDAASRHKQATEILESGVSTDAIPDAMSNIYLNGIKSDLGRAEARLEQESAVLGQNHPQYLRTSAEAQGLRDKLQSELKKLVAGLGNAAAQARKREQEIAAALEKQKEHIINLKDYRIELAAMSRDVDSAQRSYDAVLTRHMANQIDSRARQTNVALLSPAIEPLKPQHPKVGLIAGLSVVVGALLAVAVVYILETLDRRVRSRTDLESRLAVPSLGRLSRWQPAGGRLLPAPLRAARALPQP